MSSESEMINNDEIFYLAESKTLQEEIVVDEIYEIIEEEYMNDMFPNYDTQEGNWTQDILEGYKILFWGITAFASWLLWLYLFIDKFINIKVFRYFN